VGYTEIDMLDGRRRTMLVVALAVFGWRATPARTQQPPVAVAASLASSDAGSTTAMPPTMLTVPEVERTLRVDAPPVRPKVAPSRPRKPKGIVFAHGGGSDAPLDHFAELCREKGPLVVIPTASDAAERARTRQAMRTPWLRRGLPEVVVLHARDREEALGEGFVEPLRTASCAWLVGGRQGRLEERYVGTPVEQELHALLRRGGVVGGSSAGSAILSRVMIHHGNPDPVEGTGFGILPGIIVDQHFLARQREPRLMAMVERYPELVGLGIDEATALVVQGDRFRVVGDSVVRRCTAHEGCADLPAGASGRLSALAHQ
jgi:cyanophycinase